MYIQISLAQHTVVGNGINLNSQIRFGLYKVVQIFSHDFFNVFCLFFFSLTGACHCDISEVEVEGIPNLTNYLLAAAFVVIVGLTVVVFSPRPVPPPPPPPRHHHQDIHISATWLFHQRSLISCLHLAPPPPSLIIPSPPNHPLAMKAAFKDVTLKGACHWVVNVILRVVKHPACHV